VLQHYGFEPVRADGEIRLRNCPFDAIAKDHTALVCGLNLALAEGLLAGLGAEGVDVRLDPLPGTCCVAFSAGRKRKSG
jgi:predicted ArsR family transcriptional regulator